MNKRHLNIKQTNHSTNEDKKWIVVWGDIISIHSFLLSLIISVTLTMGLYFVAPSNQTMKLFFGLGGAILGVIISSLIIKPKREIKIEDEERGGVQ